MHHLIARRHVGMWAALLIAVLGLGFASANAQSATPFAPTTPRPNMFLDVDWYRQTLISSNDEWNGGLDGTSGLGAYQDGFSGFFHMNLDRQFRQTRMQFTSS